MKNYRLKPKILNIYVFISIFSFFSTGCSYFVSPNDYFREIESNVYNRNFSDAISILESSKGKLYKEKDKVLFYLDLGMLYHFNKEYEKSNSMLSYAEEAIDQNFTKSISKIASSFLLNDNILDYAGEDFEDIYLNIFKALNYIELNLTDDAFVEIRRIDYKLTKLENKYKDFASTLNRSNYNQNFQNNKNRFYNSCLGRYLSLLLYRNAGRMDDVAIDLNKIKEGWKLQSQIYNFPLPQFDDVFKTNKPKVNFISFIGISPKKYANEFTLVSGDNIFFIYQSDGKGNYNLAPVMWNNVHKGLLFKVSLPYIEKQGTEVKKVIVEVDGRPVNTLEKIESLENAAEETFNVKKPIIYLKSIVRAITKGILYDNMSKKIDRSIDNDALSFLARLLTGAIVYSSENPDLRLSKYFPAFAFVGNIEIPEGMHDIKFKYLDTDDHVLFTDNLGQKHIASKKLNLFESFYLK